MLKAQDVRVVTFDKAMRGYNTEDVDAFLAQLATQLETMETEKTETEKKLYMLAEKVSEYRKDENNLKAALLNAQRLGENVIQEANSRAAVILREAEEKAHAIIEKTSQQLDLERMELARLQEEVGRFKSNILALYRQHIESLSTLPDAPVEEEPVAEPEPEVQEPVSELQLPGQDAPAAGSLFDQQ